MKFMVIETFAPNCKALVYERFHQKGRMLPEGLHYIDSWLKKDGDRCFQLMETDSPELFDSWIKNWSDLVSFEIIEIEPRKPAATKPTSTFKNIAPRLPAANLKCTLDFYTRILGFNVRVLWPEDEPAFCMLEREGVCLGFHQAQGAGEVSTSRPCEFSIEVTNVQALYESLRERVKIEWGPEVYHYHRREFAICDPDGYMLIFTEPTDDPPTCPEEG